MSSVPMPRDLSEGAVRKWVRVVAECDLPAKDCRSCQQTARAVLALVEAKVREALLWTDHFIPGDYPPLRDVSIETIVARVMSKEATNG